MSRRESLTTIFAPGYLTFEGSVDDDETLEAVKHWVEKIDFDSFQPDEPRQVTAKIGETFYYVCPDDILLPLNAMRERIKHQRERRHVLDRRHKDREESKGRRSSDKPPAA